MLTALPVIRNALNSSEFTKTNGLFLTDNIGVAIYSYEPKHEGDLGFEKGEKLKILNKWAAHKHTVKTGSVPPFLKRKHKPL